MQTPATKTPFQSSSLRELLCQDDPPVWIMATSSQGSKEEIAVPDAISLGLVSELEARTLWDM